MTQLATVFCLLGIGGLFLLDRDWQTRTSRALWLPVFWLFIAGSRAMSAWLDMSPVSSPDQYLEGSPLDRNLYTALLAIGLIVLFARRAMVGSLLRENRWIVVFLAYCAVSIAWSDYPDVAFKRWIKSLGDFVMIVIVLTDANPSAAIKRVFSRIGFVLLPLSILFIKYYPDLGRQYGRWEGTMYYVGVTGDKNMLGMTCLVFGLGASWQFLQELRGLHRSRILLAQGVTLAMALYLVWAANSMTSLACLVIATALIASLTFLGLDRKRVIVHLVVAGLLIGCYLVLFAGTGGGLINALGRDETLTGRTELWDRLLGMASNPILGAGFESFWLGERLEKLWSTYWWHPNESHNGYLEVYLNLGWAGIGLLTIMVLKGYKNVLRILDRDPEGGRLRLAYFVVCLVYNLTEAAIRTFDPVWIMFMLSIVALPQVEASEAEGSPSEIHEAQEVA